MPILKFSGVKKCDVIKYSKLIDEISILVNAKPENIMFICENSKVFIKDNKSKAIYITVEWMKRENKEQLLVDHLIKFFKNDKTNVCVFFTDINNKWYMNGNKVG